MSLNVPDPETTPSTPASAAPAARAIAHLELFRTGVLQHLNILLNAPMVDHEDALANTRTFVETYSRAPAPAPRAPPPTDERCVALRGNGKQCTRRRKEGTFCGTHARCTQTATTLSAAPASAGGAAPRERRACTERALRAAPSSSGIPQFVDADGVAWCAEDVCAEHANPRAASITAERGTKI